MIIDTLHDSAKHLTITLSRADDALRESRTYRIETHFGEMLGREKGFPWAQAAAFAAQYVGILKSKLDLPEGSDVSSVESDTAPIMSFTITIPEHARTKSGKELTSDNLDAHMKGLVASANEAVLKTLGDTSAVVPRKWEERITPYDNGNGKGGQSFPHSC